MIGYCIIATGETVTVSTCGVHIKGVVEEIKVVACGIICIKVLGQWYSDPILFKERESVYQLYWSCPLPSWFPLVHQPRVSLFANASEYDCWMSKNCWLCQKYEPDAVELEEFQCEIDCAITYSLWNGRTISYTYAVRMGMLPWEEYGWMWRQQCMEFVQVMRWYSVFEFNGIKHLGLGPYSTEQEANDSVVELQDVLHRVKEEGRLKDNFELKSVSYTVEYLPKNGLSEICFLYEGMKKHEIKG
jgi:hypothetical protein